MPHPGRRHAPPDRQMPQKEESAAEVMDSGYIRMARLHGIPEGRIVLRHALRNALAPAVQLLANSIA